MSSARPVAHIDPVGITEACLNGMFVTMFQHEGARCHLGYARISPFHSDEGIPGWYLWLDGRTGAYGMKITDAVCLPGGASDPASQATVAARLTVAYFPDPEEKIFETFSWFERITRMSSLFDDSGTPTVEGRRQIPDSFFTIGHIDLLLTPDSRLRELTCTAAEIWMDLRPDGLVLTDDRGRPFQAVRPGDTDRTVPGWSLSQFLLDKIVCGFLFGQHSDLRSVSGHRFGMPEFLIDGDNRIEKRFNHNLEGCAIHLTLHPPHAPQDEVHQKDPDGIWQERLTGTAYPSRSQWETVWRGRDARTSDWGCAPWWDLKHHHHMHDRQDHLCKCYTDH